MNYKLLRLVILLFYILPISTWSQSESDIVSEVIKTEAEELILFQKVNVKAAIKDVWKAYTTNEGWRSWASPHVEIDLKIGGTIQTHYDTNSKIGDPGTNTLHIVNYVPERLLTLKAELSERWPEVMKKDEGKLMNVIVFQELRDNNTLILSYGVGYRDLPAYHDLMKFFIPANEGLFKKLKDYLEH